MEPTNMIQVPEWVYRLGEAHIKATKNPLLVYQERYSAGRATIIETLCEDTMEPLARAVRVPGAPGVYPRMRGYAIHRTIWRAIKTDVYRQGYSGGLTSLRGAA